MSYGVNDIITEISGFLEKLGCKFDVQHENGDCVIAHNPYTDRDLTVEITKSDALSEMTLYFAEQHWHYDFDGLPDLLDTIRAIIDNEIGDGEVYLGEERRLSFGGNVYRADVESKPYTECFGSVMSGYVYEQCRENGAEIRFKFWDLQYDKTVIIEKGSAL